MEPTVQDRVVALVLRAVRAARDLDQATVAPKLGVSTGSAVGLWENGRRRLPERRYPRVSDFVGGDFDSLVQDVTAAVGHDPGPDRLAEAVAEALERLGHDVDLPAIVEHSRDLGPSDSAPKPGTNRAPRIDAESPKGEGATHGTPALSGVLIEQLVKEGIPVHEWNWSAVTGWVAKAAHAHRRIQGLEERIAAIQAEMEEIERPDTTELEESVNRDGRAVDLLKDLAQTEEVLRATQRG